jgi:hypothetical protein
VAARSIEIVLESIPGTELENLLGVVLCSVLRVYLEASSEQKSNMLGVYNQVQSGVYFRVYMDPYILEFGFKFVECSIMHSIKYI